MFVYIFSDRRQRALAALNVTESIAMEREGKQRLLLTFNL